MTDSTLNVLEGRSRYRFQISRRMRKTRGSVLPGKGIIRLSHPLLLGRDISETTLKHEMVHLWLYERGRA